MRNSPPPRLWLTLGRLLPTTIRDRVFEPICLDLWRTYSLDRNRGTLGAQMGLCLRFAGSFGATLWYAIPSYFISQGRLHIIGRAVLVGMMVVALTLIVLLLPWIVQVVEIVIPGG